MILNAKNNNFIFNFPKIFFPESITSKYEKYLNRLPLPFETMKDFVNHSVQSVTFPAFSIPVIEQEINKGDIIYSKGGKLLRNYMEKELSVTFKITEGYLNYFFWMDVMTDFYSYDSAETYKPFVYLRFLDNSGYEFVRYKFDEIIIKGMSTLELSYNSNIPTFNTFTVDFAFNYYKIEKTI